MPAEQGHSSNPLSSSPRRGVLHTTATQSEQDGDTSQQYSMVLSSMSHANSHEDALGMFLAQMASGHVAVEIHNSETNETFDLDEMGAQNAEDQVDLAIALIARHAATMSAHARARTMARLHAAMRYERDAAHPPAP